MYFGLTSTRGNRHMKGGKKPPRFHTPAEAMTAMQTHWNANHGGKRDMQCNACRELDRDYSKLIHRGQ